MSSVSFYHFSLRGAAKDFLISEEGAHSGDDFEYDQEHKER